MVMKKRQGWVAQSVPKRLHQITMTAECNLGISSTNPADRVGSITASASAESGM